MHRIEHAQQGHPAKQQSEHDLAVARPVRKAGKDDLPGGHKGDQKRDVIDQTDEHASALEPETPEKIILAPGVHAYGFIRAAYA